MEHPVRSEMVEIARVLVLIQGAILIVSALESLIAGSALGLAIPPPIISGALALVMLAAAAGLGRRAAWARRVPSCSKRSF